jgi:hypothetical protein
MVAHMNLIVVTTYEEALIIGGLLDNMVGEPTLGGFHVLVVDDASLWRIRAGRARTRGMQEQAA